MTENNTRQSARIQEKAVVRSSQMPSYMEDSPYVRHYPAFKDKTNQPHGHEHFFGNAEDLYDFGDFSENNQNLV